MVERIGSGIRLTDLRKVLKINDSSLMENPCECFQMSRTQTHGMQDYIKSLIPIIELGVVMVLYRGCVGVVNEIFRSISLLGKKLFIEVVEYLRMMWQNFMTLTNHFDREVLQISFYFRDYFIYILFVTKLFQKPLQFLIMFLLTTSRPKDTRYERILKRKLCYYVIRSLYPNFIEKSKISRVIIPTNIKIV